MSEWWSPAMAGLIGGIGGGGLGTLCGVLGAVAGVAAPRGKCKGLVVGGFVLLIAVGVVAAAAGVVALMQSQPYHVWYPLLLCGALSSMIPGFLLPVLLVRYRQADARRLQAEELRRM